MSSKIIVEGAAKGRDSRYLQVRLREAFSKLLIEERSLKKSTFVAAGSRGSAFKLFNNAHVHAKAGDYVALLVDSEDSVADIEQTWTHLMRRDKWEKPAGADDEQVLLMTTCMETWIVSDRRTLKEHYGANSQESALPPLNDMEARERHAVQDALAHATRNCKNAFQKGKRSFEVVEKLDPSELRKHLPSFRRCERILARNL